MLGRLVPRRKRPAEQAAPQSIAPASLPEGDLPVLGLDALLDRTGTAQLVAALRTRLGFPKELFDTAAKPVIAAFADLVQLLPASESHHHADPGGLFTHSIEVAGFALDYRRGEILPKGAAPEEIVEQAHRWTYAVFVAALLHDVGKPLADLRVHMRSDAWPNEPWSPLAGSMTARGATSYRVEFAAHDTRSDQLPAKLPVLLLQRFVPAHFLGWLSEDRELMRALLGLLAGEEMAKRGVLHQLVARADAESVKRNLLAGSRTRFSTEGDYPAAIQGRIEIDDRKSRLGEAGQSGGGTAATNGQPEGAAEADEYLEPVEEPAPKARKARTQVARRTGASR